ncbi:MAG: hypothetical protein ACLVJ6_04645 [Merdibacter sp.]
MEDVLRIGGVGVDVLAARMGPFIYMTSLRSKNAWKIIVAIFTVMCFTVRCCTHQAFCIQEMMRLAKQHDLSLDVVSGGELYTALAAGVDPKRIYFHGNNKSPREIEEALQAGVVR